MSFGLSVREYCQLHQQTAYERAKEQGSFRTKPRTNKPPLQEGFSFSVTVRVEKTRQQLSSLQTTTGVGLLLAFHLLCTMTQRQTHDRLIGDLESRLRKKEHYHLIDRNVTYDHGKLTGEFDLFTTWNRHAHYYEIKCHDTHHARQRAKRQFERAAQAFPSFHWQFIYVTQERVCRYRNGRFYAYDKKR